MSLNIDTTNLTQTAQLILEVFKESGYDEPYIHSKADQLRGRSERAVFAYALTSLDASNLEKLKWKL